VDKPGKLKDRAKKIKAENFAADGLFLAPGFVDLHCRIHEPGAEHVENFETGSHSAAAGGFTTLLVQPFSDPVHDNAFMTDFILRRAREHSRVRVIPMGALSHAREGKTLAEIGGMASGGARAMGDCATWGSPSWSPPEGTGCSWTPGRFYPTYRAPVPRPGPLHRPVPRGRDSVGGDRVSDVW